MLLLKDRQRYLDLPDLNVLSDCPTRWGSFLKNGRRLIEIKQPLSLTLNKEERDDLDLTFKEWTILEELVKVLAPFDAATTLYSGNTYFTLNHVLPSMHQLHKYLSIEPSNESPVLKTFKQAMKENLEQRYSDTHSK